MINPIPIRPSIHLFTLARVSHSASLPPITLRINLLNLLSQRTDPLIQLPQILQQRPLRQLPQTRPAHAILRQQIIHKLIHKRQKIPPLPRPPSNLPIIPQQRLQRAIHIHRVERQAHVERRQRAQVLEVPLVQILQHDLAVGQQLQELEGQAEEGGGFLLAVRAAEVGHLDGAVAQRGFVDGEALLLPVVGVGDAVADGFFEEVRRVLVVDRVAFVAALVEHALGVDVVGHGAGGRAESFSGSRAGWVVDHWRVGWRLKVCSPLLGIVVRSRLGCSAEALGGMVLPIPFLISQLSKPHFIKLLVAEAITGITLLYDKG